MISLYDAVRLLWRKERDLAPKIDDGRESAMLADQGPRRWQEIRHSIERDVRKANRELGSDRLTCATGTRQINVQLHTPRQRRGATVNASRDYQSVDWKVDGGQRITLTLRVDCSDVRYELGHRDPFSADDIAYYVITELLTGEPTGHRVARPW